MVKLRFIIKDSVLVLRISEFKNRYYKRVGNILKGTPNLEKHWKADKERFSSYAVNYVENNKALEDYKAIFEKLIKEHPEFTAKQVAEFYSSQSTATMPGTEVSSWEASEYCNSLSKFLEIVVIREKAKQGCNFESYYKLLVKCRKILPGFQDMTFSMLNYNKMVAIAYSLAMEKGYFNTAKTFRAFLGKAHKDENVKFRLSQIGDFKFRDYDPGRNEVANKHPDVLTKEQLRTFLNYNSAYLTPSYTDRWTVGLYYDFCVFMLHSFFAPCDAIKAKLTDITSRNTLLVKRKKTHRSVEIPITPILQFIIDKYQGLSKDGYIFPIMDDDKEKAYETKDYIFKRFREKLNIWLKTIGKGLGTEFNLYAYVFRHTAITVALDSGLPVTYVANAAGTSVEIIQKHYYNGESVQNREMLTKAFMMASV